MQEWRVSEFSCQGPAVCRSGESQSLTAKDLPYAGVESQSLAARDLPYAGVESQSLTAKDLPYAGVESQSLAAKEDRKSTL